MRHALPAKLRITAALLGCSRRKDLCARFRQVNPATEFDLERSHKWLQGRAAPRSPRVYDDWALVLGSKRPGAWIAACTIDAFIEETARLFDADEAALRAIAADHEPAAATAGQAAPGGAMQVAYACYSPAWSPYFRGQLLRGSLYLEQQRGGERRLVYRERIGDAQIEFRGVAEAAGRTICAMLHAVGDGLPLCFILHQPGMPASALAGMMLGSTYFAQEARPTSCRFVAVQVPQAAALEESNRYFEPAAGAVANDLMALGLPPAAASAADAAILALLRAGAALDQIELSEQTRIAEAVDRGWILLHA